MSDTKIPVPPKLYCVAKSKVRSGTVLVADGGFTCIHEGAHLTVKQDPKTWDLYVECTEGRHFLDGQLNDGGEYVGFLLAPESA